MPSAVSDRAPRERSPRAVFALAYLALAGLGILQVVVSSAWMPMRMDIRALFLLRAVDVPLALAAYLLILAAVARVAGVDRLGFARHFSISLLALLPVVVAIAAVPTLVDRLDVGIRYRGSIVGKALSELVAVGLALALAIAYDVHRRYRAREAQALQLEARLAEARLRALSSQLQPHFLFNTLNAISVILHRDPRAADAMLVGLAELLRATLQQREAQEIPLREELALLERYLEIMRHRYGTRLTVELAVAPDTRELLVPPFVLQPLVENALEHGVGNRAGPATVRIVAARAGDRLRLDVIDDGTGPGLDRADDADDGIGLSTTRHRLEQLYGSAQRLVLEPVESGRGARAVIELPARVPHADARVPA